MIEWKRIKLSEVCNLIAGYAFKSCDFGDYPKKVVKITNIEPPYVNMQALVGFNEKNYDIKKLEKYRVSSSDYILAMTGATIGKIGRIRLGNAYINQRVLKFCPKKIDNDFLFYILSMNDFSKYIINNIDSESAQANISASTIGKYTFSLPPLDVQRKIAGILGALDDRIDVLRRENVVLEQMAQAVFQSWFVDFDIVRAKAAGTPESEVCEKYHITPELYALFPSALTPDNLPLGWEKKSLPEIATYLNGLPLQKFPPKNEDEFLPVIKIAELKARSVVGADKASTDIDSKYIIDDGDVIFSWSGSLAVDIWCCGKGALNQHLFKVFSSDYPKWFYYLWTKSYLFQFQQIAAGKATTMGHIQRAHLEEAKANVPSEKILEVTDKIISPLIEKIIENSKQIRALSATRDALLPKLMNGEIEV